MPAAQDVTAKSLQSGCER